MGSRYAFVTRGNGSAEGDCCAGAIHILVGQLSFGHDSSLCTTDWHGRGGVVCWGGQYLCFLTCELQPLAGVLVAKMQQDFIPL